MKIVTILGARPQFIKAGTVSREILSFNQSEMTIDEVIVHTGQHFDKNMSNIFFDEMQIPKPIYNLGVSGNSHGLMTGRMIEKIEEVLIKELPDWVLLYGDTNSTLAGAIAASKLHINIAHVEAGLRSFNQNMPEEINRILTDRVSTLLFCPSEISVNNLEMEGISNWQTNSKVVLSGDVMLDGAIFYKKFASRPAINDLDNNFILCTIHRAENTDNLSKLMEIFGALNEIAKNHQVVLPIHPRTKKIISENNIKTGNIKIIEPVGYLNMVWLLNNCGLVMTDSGGLQKEAYFFGAPCITIRDETEWTELVNARVNTLVGANKTEIIQAHTHYKDMLKNLSQESKLYGDGEASKKIVRHIINFR